MEYISRFCDCAEAITLFLCLFLGFRLMREIIELCRLLDNKPDWRRDEDDL